MSILSEASNIVKRKWRNTPRVGKVALFMGLIILVILAVAGLALWFLGRLVKGLTTGGFRNRDLYIPRVRRW